MCYHMVQAKRVHSEGSPMPPMVKFTKDEITQAAFRLASEKGADAVTARELARALGASTRPIFTYYSTMGELKRDVVELAKARYRGYIEQGLAEPVPFLGVGRAYIRFAREESELYRLLFLTRPDETGTGPMEALRFTQGLVRESIMRIYNMDAAQADAYFRDLWLVAFSFATMVVCDECPYSDAEMDAVFSEMSLAVCKAYKEVPGLSDGSYDKDAVFGELVRS